MILICIVGIISTANIISLPLGEVTNLSLAMIGILAGLSGLCFSIYSAPTVADSDRNKFVYCGEKFLHSCILIIQSLACKYAYSHIIAVAIVEKNQWLSGPVTAVFSLIILVLSAFAFYCMYYGFEMLNDILWGRYIKRHKDMG